MATVIKSLNGEPAICKAVKVTLPLELLAFVTDNYPHMPESAAVRAYIMDEYSAYLSSSKKLEEAQ
jgi:hypothetical protein